MLAPSNTSGSTSSSHRVAAGTGSVRSAPPDGYGRFTFRRNNRQRAISAHRLALLLVHPRPRCRRRRHRRALLQRTAVRPCRFRTRAHRHPDQQPHLRSRPRPPPRITTNHRHRPRRTLSDAAHLPTRRRRPPRTSTPAVPTRAVHTRRPTRPVLKQQDRLVLVAGECRIASWPTAEPPTSTTSSTCATSFSALLESVRHGSTGCVVTPRLAALRCGTYGQAWHRESTPDRSPRR